MKKEYIAPEITTIVVEDCYGILNTYSGASPVMEINDEYDEDYGQL